MEQINRLYRHYEEDGCVFKTCFDYVVILRKQHDTITNEERSDVMDAKHAKFRGSHFLVELIFDKNDPTKTIDTIKNSVCHHCIVTYTVGEITKADTFDTNIDKICASGIHYFKSLSAAFYYKYDFYSIKNHHKDTECLIYDDNGTMTFKLNYINGKCQGDRLEYHPNGKLKSTSKYDDGVCNSEYLEYHQNGQLKLKYYYVDNLRSGDYLEYHYNGNLKITCNYIDGKYNGEYLSYYTDGALKVKCNYVNGKLKGEWYEYYNDGKLKDKSNYVNGRLHGPCQTYYPNGDIEYECNYKYGECDGLYSHYSENRRIHKIGIIKNGCNLREIPEYYVL
jgi:antitoxin component YwqK of YwqJK toxin-antitoxin module